MKYRTGLKTTEGIVQAVEELLGAMTLEEKLGQMTQSVGADIVAIGTTMVKEPVEGLIRSARIGSMIQVGKPEEMASRIRRFQKIAVEETRLGIPLLFSQDVIHGFETVFPIPLACSSSFDMQLIQKAAQIAAKEATICGINYLYSPMVDIAHDPRWGRVAEGAGEDPYLGAKVAEAMVKGYQGERLGEAEHSAVACLKHYLGYGAGEGGRDYNTAEFSNTALYNTYLPPFRAGVEAGAGSVMTAFNVVDGVPAVANRWLLEDVLRKQLGFAGIIISDYSAVMELMMHGVAADEQEAAEKALDATLDIEMTTSYLNQYGKKLVQKNPRLQKRIDDAVRRILTIKYRLGLMDDPYKFLQEDKLEKTIFCQEHLDFSRHLAENSAVLLENDGILPLKKGQKVALVGPFADSTDLCGCWAFSTRKPETVTLRQGFEQLGWQVSVEAGSDVEAAIDGGIQRAQQLAKAADVVVLALGERHDMSGESSSRMEIVIPQAQMELAQQVVATGVPTVLCLMNGRPLLLNWFAENCNGILQCYQLGSQAGLAIARLLTGAANPSGKLTLSIPRHIGQIPVYYNYLPTGRPFTGDHCSPFTTRYLDGTNDPLYPFGYGLSYTTFRLSQLQLEHSSIRPDESNTLWVTVENTGSCAGAEVVQLYMRDVSASISRPIKELKGFEKVMLQPGEKKRIGFTIDKKMLQFYNTVGKACLEPGLFRFTVGTSSADGNSLTTEMQVMDYEG